MPTKTSTHFWKLGNPKLSRTSEPNSCVFSHVKCFEKQLLWLQLFVWCAGKEGLIEHTQHPKGAEGLEKIQDLEESLRRQEGAVPEGEEGHPPVFTSQVCSSSFFRHLQLLSYSGYSSLFMEPESQLPCSQDCARSIQYPSLYPVDPF